MVSLTTASTVQTQTEAPKRSIPDWLAGIVQDLELERRPLVTVADVERARPELDATTARRALMELAARGWLQPVGLRGVYEFIPGAAAGPYPSGDPWLVLRAALQRWPGRFHVGANSAAWLRGYAQRSPSPHILVTRPNSKMPLAIKQAYRVLATDPAPSTDTVDGLPVPSPAELLAEVAQLAPLLKLDAATGWLRRLLQDATPPDVAEVLGERNKVTRARAGFIAEACGAGGHADAIASLGPIGRGPFYTGRQRRGAPFSSRWRVYDTGGITATQVR